MEVRDSFRWSIASCPVVLVLQEPVCLPEDAEVLEVADALGCHDHENDPHHGVKAASRGVQVLLQVMEENQKKEEAVDLRQEAVGAGDEAEQPQHE